MFEITLGADLAALTIKHPHNRCRSVLAVRTVNLQALGAVHLLRLWAYMRLIHFDRAVTAHLHEAARLHCLTDAMQHEPCGFLSDANGLGQFIAADSVLASGQHPDSSHPLVHADRGILENGSDLHRELLLATIAEPYPTGLEERMGLRAATGAIDASIRPTKLHSIAESAVGIGEVNYCLLESYRSLESVRHKALHQTKNSLRRMFSCVKYVIAVTTMGITCAAKVWRTF